MKLTLDGAQTIVSLNLEEAREMAKYDHRTSEYWPTVIGERLWFLNILNNIEVELIKHGRWLKSGQSLVYPDRFRNYFCSKCGFELDTYIRKEPNYCPNCGVKMDGREND